MIMKAVQLWKYPFPKIIEFYTLNGWIGWHVNYILLNLLKIIGRDQLMGCM